VLSVSVMAAFMERGGARADRWGGDGVRNIGRLRREHDVNANFVSSGSAKRGSAGAIRNVNFKCVQGCPGSSCDKGWS
jgi:hypothetical protein